MRVLPQSGTGTGYGGTGLTTFTGANNALYSTSSSALTAGTLPVAAGGTGVTASTGASSVMLRDANQNTTINNIAFGTATTTTSATAVILTVASPAIQNFTGSLSQNLNLPDATTLNLGAIYYINNNSAGSVVINNNGGTPLYTVSRGGATQLTLITNTTANGTWQQSAFVPNNVFWGSVALQATSTQAQFSSLTLGTALTVGNGGTGIATAPTAGSVVYGASTTAQGYTAAGTSGQVLISGGTGSPTWSTNIGGNAANVTGTVAVANGGTGQTTAAAAFNALSPITTTGDLIIGTGTNTASRLGIGSSGYSLISNGTTAAWVAFSGGATITPTTTNTAYFIVGTSATSGSLSIGSINTNVSFNPSTGVLSAPEIAATNGLYVNSATVNTSYSIPSGSNAMSVGPITVASGQSVTISSGSRWVVL